ncbi:MAG: YceI family protein [Alicyclobacillus macrosporangiidus]|uniref:YceI family protein n=1 Tax=Alicyclobacillus macrosporangiidus TaxID=392015 RepID=UPI0026EC922F|nr:YceI family protein [Alicyclobacillus macrosporangiidus]MCL6598183.1 YceI family protein [Alicyclobacillus macrosporangiidus]
MAKSQWKIDPAHSSVDFSIKHMVISRVKGTFHTFDAVIEADPEDLTTARIEFTVDVASVDTRNEDRDNHLRSADFFDAENYPKMTFKATRIVKKSEGEYEVTGDLTIRGVTRPETFLVTYEGQGKDPWGGIRAGFSANGTINRSDYGLKWNAALETGGVLVGDQVQVSLEIQAVKQG